MGCTEALGSWLYWAVRVRKATLGQRPLEETRSPGRVECFPRGGLETTCVGGLWSWRGRWSRCRRRGGLRRTIAKRRRIEQVLREIVLMTNMLSCFLMGTGILLGRGGCKSGGRGKLKMRRGGGRPPHPHRRAQACVG